MKQALGRFPKWVNEGRTEKAGEKERLGNKDKEFFGKGFHEYEDRRGKLETKARQVEVSTDRKTNLWLYGGRFSN